MSVAIPAWHARAAGRWRGRVEVALLWSDIFVVAVIMVVSHALQFGWDPLSTLLGPAALPTLGFTVGIGTLWVLELGWTRSRDIRVVGEGPEEYQRIGTAAWHTFAVVAAVGFLTQWDLSRGYLLFTLPVGTLVLFVYRRAWRTWIHEQRALGRLRQSVVIAGAPATVAEMAARLRRTQGHAYDVVGVCLSGDEQDGRSSAAMGVPVLGSLDDAVAAAEHVAADYVLLVGTDHLSLAQARRLEWAIEDSGVGLIVAPTIADISLQRVAVTDVAGLPLMHVDPPRFTGGARALKTFADRVGAAAALVILALPMAVIALAVKLSSPGPVLFRQARVGRDLQEFEMLKFRTMYVDAEARLEEIRDENQGNGVHFKMRRDPRVTSVGRVLRRFSLDELPQLFNVLRGDMSVVGPRPPLPREVAQWDDDVSRRQMVRPGLTGLWQVSGRADLSWDEAVRLDLHYTQNWSLGLDVIIILRTVWAVLAGRGAY